MIKRSMVLALLLLASGCGSQTQTNAEMRAAMVKEAVQKAGFIHKTCYALVHSNPDSVEVERVLPMAELASIAQMASTARTTPNQVTKIVAYRQNLDTCDEWVATDLRLLDPAFYDIFHRADQNLDGIILDVVQRKLNLGEAARAVNFVAQRFDQEGKALGQKIEASLYKQHNAEIAQGQAAQAPGQADMATLAAQMQQGSYQFQQQQQQYLQQSQSFQPTQVMPITPPGGNQVRCINTGIYMNCRY